jgi:UDP-glucose 4-epimerase
MKTIAITGINSYFARSLLPRLERDPDIGTIVGIDITPWKGGSRKVRFVEEDVRSPGLEKWFRDVDTVVHLAFIVEEIHDKKKSRQINVEGSKNVFHACARQGVRKLVYTSSIAAYGAHPDNPLGITEDQPLRGNPDCYYSANKEAVENCLDAFCLDHPDLIITRLRPPLILGPGLSNFARDAYTRRRAFTIKGGDPQIQFLHEDDLGEALHITIKQDLPGAFNIAPDDYSTGRRIYEIAGVKTTDVPLGVLRFIANLTFAIRLGKMSDDWVTLMEHPIVASNAKFKKAAGWSPSYSTEETFRDFLRSVKEEGRTG